MEGADSPYSPGNSYAQPPYHSITSSNSQAYSQSPAVYQPYNQENAPIQTHKKRKTGATEEERKFVCKICSKKYLSYPALYTHIKTKHNLEPASQINSENKRKRGRPKNTPDQSIEKKIKTKEYFSDPDKCGSTSDPLNVLEGTLLKLSSNKENTLYKAFAKLIITAQCTQEVSKESQDVTEKCECTKTCDEILAEYLAYASQISKREFFQVVSTFVVLYRDCFNKAQPDRSSKENGEKLPDKSNEFVTSYVESQMENNNAVDLTLNLCEWLFSNSYTCLKLSLISH